jgi:short-subunit dehydrogenase
VSGLDGKRVLLVGASSGIGIPAAERFAQRGADLALVARGDGLAKAGERVRRHGRIAHELRVDVTDRPALARIVKEAEAALGGLDVVALNVGAASWGRFDEVSADEFDRVVDVTFRSVVDATRLVLPALERSHGTLVITGSVAGRIPLPMMSSYTAAKHALHGFAGSLRIELRARRSPVRVSVVAPGPVDTPFWKHAASTTGQTALAPSLAPYSPETVAEAIVAAAERPRREVTIGGAMVVARGLYGLAGTIVETAMAIGIRRYLLGDDGSPADLKTLERPTGQGEIDSGLGGRPSLLGALRRVPGGLSRAVRADGR